MATCQLKPIIKNKPSIFYTKLFKYTKNNRKLTNLLYGISLLSEIKAKFDKKELNSQNEPELEVFIEKLNVKLIIDDSNLISVKAEELGAVDKNGEQIEYNNVYDILDDVQQFNEKNTTIKAQIKFKNGKYVIDIDTVNADNFNINNSLEIRQLMFDAFIDYLNSKGLNTQLSEESKNTFNPVTVHWFINKLLEIADSETKLNPQTASVLVDLFIDNNFVKRLINNIGKKDLITALSQESGYNISEEEQVNLEPNIKELVAKCLTDLRKKINNILDGNEIDTVLTEAKSQLSATPTFGNTTGISVRKTLNELYNTYHIDQESLNLLNQKINAVSDLAKQLLQIRIKKLQEAKLKGEKVNSEEWDLKQLLRLIEQSQYHESLLESLTELFDRIDSIADTINKLEKKLKLSPDSLRVIREYSQIILELIDMYNSFYKILTDIINIDLLENDSDTQSSQIELQIVEIAKQLKDIIEANYTNARKKQFDVVHAFLKTVWGEDTEEAKAARGTDITLDDIIREADGDINFFDRFIYAANTSNDKMMALIAETVNRAHKRRDAILKKQHYKIRVATDLLYKSGSDTKFMFEMDKNGNPDYIISDFDYQKFDEEYKKYKEEIRNDKNISYKKYSELERKWLEKHREKYEYHFIDSNGDKQTLTVTVPIYKKSSDVKSRLTKAQYEYYKTMMDMRAEQILKIDNLSEDSLFEVIEIRKDNAEKIASGDMSKMYSYAKDYVTDLLQKLKEDSVEFGDVLAANDMKQAHIDVLGNPIYNLPLYFSRKNRITDRNLVTTDFSKAMVAFLATTDEFYEMNKILDALMLSKDYMLHVRKVATTENDKNLVDLHSLGKQKFLNVASKLGVETSLGSLSDDYYQRVVFGRKRKDERFRRVADVTTTYTSVAGLTVNFLGALANLFVGKLQMLIESGLGMGGEFFGMKDLLYADRKYFLEIIPVLGECMSNNKSSWMGLLMEEYDVLGDFYDKVKESGFYKSPISKIIGNTSLFFMYGLGEHLLHALGMLAVLHNTKVLDANGKEARLVDAYEVKKDKETDNGEIVIKKGWKTLDGKEIDDKFINKIKQLVKYVNDTCHGAFSSDDRGMIHRYAIGRLIMNFRLWMPAHYARRFRGRYYHAGLGQMREGYYVTAYKFIKDMVTGLKSKNIIKHWKQLSSMEKYNLKRCMAEAMIIIGLWVTLSLLGDEKDHKGNWAYRNLIYQLKRMQMETYGSSPFGLNKFLENAIKLMNSPIAATDTWQKWTRMFNLTTIFDTIEGGKYKGDNLYLHNLAKDLPFYYQLKKTYQLAEEDIMFRLFD